MATKRTLAASGELISKTEKLVVTTLTVPQVVYLPIIDNGTNGQVVGSDIGIFNNGTQNLEVRTLDEHLVKMIAPGAAFVFTAEVASYAWQVLGNAMIQLLGNDAGVAGSGTPALTHNLPAAAAGTAITSWLTVTQADGTPGYIPVWG